MPRPILTARWTELLMLNFPVPVETIAPLAPPGTEPDLHDGQTYISVIGFRFHAVRFLGLAIPGHTCFPEINLRYYVRRHVGNETRRGVVFVREIVPRRAVAIVANRLYHENYITRPMRATITMNGPALAPNDTLEYAWRSPRRWGLAGHHRRDGRAESSEQKVPVPLSADPLSADPLSAGWNRLAARVTAPLAIPATGSLEEFIVEHYWGYTRARDGTTREYQVAHVPWQVAPADSVTWDCELVDFSPPHFRGEVRGGAALAEYLQQPPTSAVIAAGSPIQLFRGTRI
jgi:uncharacterized protein YqjF (DUF2071 family)